MLALRTRRDLVELGARFRTTGRAHLPELLESQGCEALYASLLARTDWVLIFNRGDRLYEMDEAYRRALSETQLRDLMLAVHNEGRNQFQYLFETLRVPDSARERRRSADPIFHAAEFLNSAPFLELVRAIVGRDDIVFADCQATCYRPGHFLNTHDDDVQGKGRIAAYVLNLTPAWRPEWGGQLQFVSPDGHIAEAYVPRFNALNLLRVPQPHLVSAVSPLAPRGAMRLSLTGWLRAGPQPD